MPYKVFVAGEEALAADVNSYLMSQTVARFTNASQRTSQLTAPVLNQLSALDSRPGIVQYWNGSAWTDILAQTVFTAPDFGGSTATTPALFSTVTVPNLTFGYRALILVNFVMIPAGGTNSGFVRIRVNTTGAGSAVGDTLLRESRVTGAVASGSPTAIFDRASGGPLTVGIWCNSDGPTIGFVGGSPTTSQLQVLVQPI